MDWLKAIRDNLGMSQSSVAKTVGISQPTYSNIEIGARRPSVDTAKAIASALGFDWTRFFEDEQKQPPCGG